MRKSLWVVAGLAPMIMTLAVGGPAQAAGDNCLRVGQIYNWQAKDNSTLIVEDTFHRKFTVGLLGSCINLKFKQRIGFSSPGGTSLSCLSAGDTVFFNDHALGRQRCSVKSVAAYTPEMEKADKAKEAAKKAAEDVPKDATPKPDQTKPE